MKLPTLMLTGLRQRGTMVGTIVMAYVLTKKVMAVEETDLVWSLPYF